MGSVEFWHQFHNKQIHSIVFCFIRFSDDTTGQQPIHHVLGDTTQKDWWCYDDFLNIIFLLLGYSPARIFHKQFSPSIQSEWAFALFYFSPPGGCQFVSRDSLCFVLLCKEWITTNGLYDDENFTIFHFPSPYCKFSVLLFLQAIVIIVYCILSSHTYIEWNSSIWLN